MRVLFLDIDGVLNHTAFFLARRADRVENGVTIVERQNEDDLDPMCVARLNRVLDATGAFCVVSSSWRVFHELPEIERAMRARGFTGTIVDKTPRIHGPRGREIQAWLDAHQEVTRFAIVDDDRDMLHLCHFQVKTDCHGGGLLDEHVTALVKLLGLRCVWCDSTGFIPETGIMCRTCHGSGVARPAEGAEGGEHGDR